jgi:hypothetical protein
MSVQDGTFVGNTGPTVTSGGDNPGDQVLKPFDPDDFGRQLLQNDDAKPSIKETD